MIILIIVENVSIHLDQLLIKFKLNSFWLIFLFEFLHIQPFCQLIHIISKQ